jgi:PAS domain S-box-containing protein
MILRFAFEGAGYDVTTATNGTEALEKLRTTKGAGENEVPFPVAIIDIMMPGTDGLDVLRTIRKEFPDTVSVMLTAHVSMESAIKSLNEGAFSYLTKPVNISEIKIVAGNAYEKYELVQQNRRLVEELKKTNKYSEIIIRNLVYTVIATDTNGFIRKVNKATEELLGFKENELIGNPLESVFSEDFGKTAWPDLKKEGKVKDYPVVFLAKGNKEIKVLFTGTILKDEDGQAIGFLGTIRK